MRNLIQYPVTSDEVKRSLASIPNSAPGAVGGLQPLIKTELLKYFCKPEVMSDFLARLRF